MGWQWILIELFPEEDQIPAPPLPSMTQLVSNGPAVALPYVHANPVVEPAPLRIFVFRITAVPTCAFTCAQGPLLLLTTQSVTSPAV